MFYTNLTCLNYHADFSTSRYCPAPRSMPEIPPACPADRSVSRYEKRSKCACRPRTTLTILRPHRRGRNGGRVPFRSRLRAFKWRPCSSTDRPAGFQRWWRSSGRSEKPNDPPGKPAGFVYNNEAVRPAVELRSNFVRLFGHEGSRRAFMMAELTNCGHHARIHRGPHGPRSPVHFGRYHGPRGGAQNDTLAVLHETVLPPRRMQ